MSILAIDPGCSESAYVYCADDLTPLEIGKLDNEKLLEIVALFPADDCVIEMVACYGMAVGAEVFETCVWIGRIAQRLSDANHTVHKVYRKDVKMNLCHSMKATDSNIRQALIDRFGGVGTKKAPGWFYGFARDVWSAYAIAVTFSDMEIEELEP